MQNVKVSLMLKRISMSVVLCISFNETKPIGKETFGYRERVRELSFEWTTFDSSPNWTDTRMTCASWILNEKECFLQNILNEHNGNGKTTLRRIQKQQQQQLQQSVMEH